MRPFAPYGAPNSVVALGPELEAWRKDIHRHPELGYEETRTAALVAEKLRSFGFDRVETGIGETGVVGVLHGAGGPTASEAEAILLRADMDALPMTEETGADHASTIPGKMHACGHDGHTTMLLGAAKRLADTRNFKGTVYVCFQPAEEGGAGAKAMIEDGLFDRFPCRAVFGMHNWPGLPVGQFAVRPGPMLASADEFRISLIGRGGHAAKPDKARDPIVAGAHLVMALQTLVSRRTDPLQPAVVSVTTFHGGSAFNVIPERVEITGTVRSFDEAVQEALHAGVREMTAQTAALFDMAAETWRSPVTYPPTVNDPEVTGFVADLLKRFAGAENVYDDARPTLGGEDFSYMAREKPGCFVFCGNGDSASLHNAKYDFNDAALPYGVAYWCRLVEEALPKGV
ncbi:MAG: M20 aminoacylase family protein [Pseudomonadota bacterium]